MSTRALVPQGVLSAAADPATPSLRAGDLYFNTGTAKLRVYTGSVWVDVDASVAAVSVTSETTYNIAANFGSSANYARQDHTHGSPATPVTAASGGNQITLGSLQTGNITIAVTTTPTFTSLASSGMTGAVAATRYAGGTSAGAPTSGTFVTGDWIIAQAGALWICTAGGTPGTWVAPGGVTSVNGGTNVSVSPTTGAVVVSLSATPTFTSVTANASSTNGFRFSTGGTPAVYESFGVSISGDTTHPVQVMSTALLVGQTGASGSTYTVGDVVATRLFEAGVRAHSANFGAATTVTSGSGFGQASVVGSLTTFAREDHQHSTHAALTAADIGAGQFPAGVFYGMPSTLQFLTNGVATSGSPTNNSFQLQFTSAYWNGTSSVTSSAATITSTAASPSGATTLNLSAGTVNATSTLTEGGARVYSASFGSSSTVAYGTSFGGSANAGAATSYSRGDHTHGTPSLSSSTPQAVGVTPTAGGTGTASDAGHVHQGVSTISGSTGISFNASTGAVTASISGLTIAQVGAGTTSANYTFSGQSTFSGTAIFTGTTIIGNKSLWNGTRTLPGSGNAVDLGTFTSTNGAFQLNLMLTVDVAGFAVTKSYELDVTASVGSASTWYRVVPSDSTQNETLTGTDFILEVNRNATTSAYTFRIRQIGATGGTLYWQGEGYGTASLAFTPSTSTTAAPAAVSTLWSPTPLFEGPGAVGVNTDNPQNALEVNGILAVGPGVGAAASGAWATLSAPSTANVNLTANSTAADANVNILVKGLGSFAVNSTARITTLGTIAVDGLPFSLASAGTVTVTGPGMRSTSRYWNGAASIDELGTLLLTRNSTTAGDHQWESSVPVKATDVVSAGVSLPRGFVGQATANSTATTASASIPGSAVTVVTGTFVITAGRRYRVTTNIFGFTTTSVATDERFTLTATTSGTPTMTLAGPSNITFYNKNSSTITPGLVHVSYWVCGATGGNVTFAGTLVHSGGSSSTITCAVNGGLMVVEDIGT